MPTITLPDGKTLAFDTAVSGRDIAESIGPGLAKAAIGVRVDDELRDLDRPIEHDAAVGIVTAKNDDEDALFLLRHSCAHVLAEAICDLLPGTKLAYGPPVEGGFYYDLATPRPLTSDDFPAIEKRMAEIVAEDRPFTRCELPPEQGMQRVAGDKYKTDNAERALARGADVLSFYVTGEPEQDWEDLCAGPHVPSTGRLKGAFKVMSVAGAYWHGDQNSDQLTRVYGTCFADKKGLKRHLQLLEEAKLRDHRRLGRELDLFHVPDDNPGQIFWHPKGWTIYRSIEQYIRTRVEAADYVEVKTPSLQPQALWERSGHWEKYRENMFLTREQDRGHGGAAAGDAGDAADDPTTGPVRVFALKPMNCPGHIEIFKTALRSYRELPLRMAEFGSCVRYEPGGALHGILRVRGFVQDDAHIFCTEEQIGDEVAEFCALLKVVYEDFGFPAEQVTVKFATRPPVRVGSDADWDRAEEALRRAVEQTGLTVEMNPGEGAFYGPKLEFVLRDCLGRDWQCGTIQVDYQLAGPDRLDATYVAEDGSRQHPVILHRAILGSLERFIGILLEHYAGKLPLWLAPEQIRILSVTDEQLDFAREVALRLRDAGLRATVASSSDKLGAKIRQARNERVNYFAVVGEREVAERSVSLQRQDGSKLGNLSIDELEQRLLAEIAEKQTPELAETSG